MLFLNSQHFTTKTDGTVSINIQGFSIILFYSRSCPHCNTMEGFFEKIDRHVNGITTGKVLLDENKDIIPVLAKSNIELTYVPFVVFFAHGSPYMIYSGPNDLKSLTDFIVEVANTHRSENSEQSSMNSFDNNPQRSVDQSHNSSSALGCKIDDKKCQDETLEQKKKEMSACYTTMENAYSNK